MGKVTNLKHVGRHSWLRSKPPLPVLGQVALLVTQYPSCKTGFAAYLMGVVRVGSWVPLQSDALRWGEQQKVSTKTNVKMDLYFPHCLLRVQSCP